MAFFCQRRQCFVCEATNKRLKGLAKHLKQKYFPVYTPPPGLGKRIGKHGLVAGKAVDEAVGSYILNKHAKGYPRWAQALARRVLDIIKRAGITKLKTQECVFSEKRQLATAIDISGWCKTTKSKAIIELKYSSHSLANTKAVYKKADPKHPYMLRGSKQFNSLYNQHMLQLRETTKLYKLEHKGVAISAGVMVICADGGIMFNRLK